MVSAYRNGLLHQKDFPLDAHFDSVSAQELDYEIGYSKQCLADHGFETTIFAYPKGLGSDNETVVNLVSKYYSLARSGSERLFFLGILFKLIVEHMHLTVA